MVLQDSAEQSNWEVSAYMGKEVDNSCATTQADSLRDTMATIAQDGYRNNDAVNAGRLDRNTNDAIPKGLPNITIDFGTTDGSDEQPKGHQPIDGGKAKTQEQLDKEDESKDLETEDSDEDEDPEDRNTDDDHDAEDDDNETDDTVIQERIHEADGGGTAGGQGDGVDVSVVARMAADAAIQAALSGASQDAASGIGTELGLSIIQAIGAHGGIERSAAAHAGVSISVLARAGAAAALAGRRSGATEAGTEVARDNSNGPTGAEGDAEGSRPQAGPVDENGTPLRPLPSNQNPSDGSWEKPKSRD